MNVRSFLDSNVFVYADDHRFPQKQKIAADLFERARLTGLGVVSTQVMQEYFSAATTKVKVPPQVARRRVELLAALPVVQVDPPLILAAIDLQRLHRLSFWDALILQAAIAGGCRELLSEDLQAGFRCGGVVVVDPFA